jgi:hypothetical protein
VRFTGFLTHAAGKATRSTDLARDLFACQIGQSCNLGLVAMAEACGISYDRLAWTAEWYLREDSLRAVSSVVNYRHRGMMSRVWGASTMSSSDGQRFPTKGKSISVRTLSRYFIHEGISTCTHVSDQHSTHRNDRASRLHGGYFSGETSAPLPVLRGYLGRRWRRRWGG